MIEIKIDDREVMETLKPVASKVDNMSPVMRQIAGDMLDAVHENFDKEGRPDKWAPLAPSTIKRLTKKGKTGKMLNRSAAGLWHSIRPESDATSAQVGTNKMYAGFLQLGTVKMPARPFLVLTDEDKRRIVMKLEKYLEK